MLGRAFIAPDSLEYSADWTVEYTLKQSFIESFYCEYLNASAF